MACKVRDEKQLAIYDTILALTRENGLKTIDEIADWFQTNRPEVTKDMIYDTLVATSPKRVSDTISHLNKVRSSILREAKIVDRLTEMVNAKIENPSGDLLKEVEMLGKELANSANVVNLGGSSYMKIAMRIDEIVSLYKDKAAGNKKFTEQNVRAIKTAIQAIKNDLKLEKLDKKLQEYESSIEKLKNGEYEADDLVRWDDTIQIDNASAEVLQKESELVDTKAALDAYRDARLTEERHKKYGLQGFKGSTAMKILKAVDVAKKEGWEVPRTIKFMLDASAWGVQGAPMVMSDLFFNPKRLWNNIKTTFYDVLASDLGAVKTAWKEDPNLSAEENAKKRGDALRRARGTEILKQTVAIKTSPLYPLMKEAGLRISESRSLGRSEEMFHTSLLNRFRILGLAKEISEDLMVAPLNAFRAQLFEQFYHANVGTGITMEDYKKVAEFINHFTGTSSVEGKAIGIAGKLLSAPRLAISRLHMAFKIPFYDIPFKGMDWSKLEFRTAADKFVAKEMAKMWASYAGTLAVFWGAAALSDDIDFGDDWEESDFLKIKAGNTVYDYTAGIGAMYRMLGRTILMIPGLRPDDLSPTVQASLELGDDKKVYDPFIRVMVKQKLHPTFNAIESVASGKDFLNQPYDTFGAGEVKSRVEGAARSFLPIFGETFINQMFLTPQSGFTEDAIVSSLQVAGVNIFEIKNKSTTPESRNWFDKTYGGRKPVTDYPKEFSTGKKAVYKDDLLLESLRAKYKEEYGTIMGNIIEKNPNITKEQFNAKLKSEAILLKRRFMNDHKESIKQLEKIK